MGVSLTLRTRIVLAFLTFGIVLSTAFAAVALTSMADFERILMRELLQVEMRNLIDRHHAQADAPLPASQRIHAHVSFRGASGNVPAQLTALAPGMHMLEHGGRGETYVAVRDDGPQRWYYVIDLSDIAQRESFLRWLMVGVILLGTLVSGLLGVLLAGRLLVPIKRLVRWVDASAPQHAVDGLRTQFVDDEIGALATAFDRYQSRLDAFLQREREFTADASHELRSPLSVLRAGLDVLTEDPGVSPLGRRTLQRMHRRAAELTDLLDALLFLARSDRDTGVVDVPVPLLATWQRLAGEQSRESHAKGTIEVEGDANAAVIAPPRMAALVFGQLLRQATEQENDVSLHLLVRSDGVEIGPWNEGIETPQQGDDQTRSDRRFGLTLIARLCERMGWDLQLPLRNGDALVLRFLPSAKNAPTVAPR